MVYEIIGIAFGVAGIGWLFAARKPGTARMLWSPGKKALLLFRILIAVLTLIVLLTAGGLVFWLGVAAAFLGGIALREERPDKELGIMTPRPIRAFVGLFHKIEKMLFGT